MFLSLSLRAVIFWIAAIVCIVAQLAILRSTLRVSRAAPAPRGDRDPASTMAPEARTPTPNGRPTVEIVWAVLPAIALLIVLAFTHEAMR